MPVDMVPHDVVLTDVDHVAELTSYEQLLDRDGDVESLGRRQPTEGEGLDGVFCDAIRLEEPLLDT